MNTKKPANDTSYQTAMNACFQATVSADKFSITISLNRSGRLFFASDADSYYNGFYISVEFWPRVIEAVAELQKRLAVWEAKYGDV